MFRYIFIIKEVDIMTMNMYKTLIVIMLKTDILLLLIVMYVNVCLEKYYTYE